MGFKKFLFLEASRISSIPKTLLLLVFFLLTIYFVQSGIGQYKENLEERKSFQEFEKIRVENFQYYAQYGTYGFRLLFIPGPLSALFSNAGIIHSNLNAFIDAGERMKIYESFKGKNAFIGFTSHFMNLTGFILLFYSLLVLFYGLESYRERDFLKFLECKISRNKLFLLVFLSRLFILFSWCLIIALTAWLLYMLNGITGIDVGMLAIYFLVTFLMLGFFLFAGILAGMFRNNSTRILVAFGVWLLFAFFVPAVVGKIIYHRAESIISTYKMDIEKFKVMMDIEKRAREIAGKLDTEKPNTEIRQQLHEYFWSNEFKMIFGYEQSMIKEMKDVVSLHHNLSLVFPTSFFLTANNEISGCGYESLLSFYERVYKQKKGFVQYYAKESFYSGKRIVKPFLTGEENIFYASSLLPDNFGFGILISLFWILLLLFLIWNRFNRVLDQAYETGKELNTDDLKRDSTNVIFTSDKALLPQLITKLRMQKIPFVSVPNPACLVGDTKVKNLFSFFGLDLPEILKETGNKFIYALDPDQKVEVLVEIARSFEADVFIFDNFLAGFSDDMLQHFAGVLDSLKKDRIIVYFTNSLMVTSIICDHGIKWTDEKIVF